ncbi:MAG: outer membrane lipoprotein carrier protein LolA [Oceanospirillaceae bacterium]|nr:outer membrane lipoprotein carrier protein LolA [Oceanospirillaceae bacterium]
MKKPFLAACLLAAASVSLAYADASDDLEALLMGHDRIEAEFDQYTVSEGGRRQEHSSGDFAIDRPGRFDWRTETPFPQRIVSDGDYIWVFDPDLEQVTRKPADNQSDSAPAQILNGEVDALERAYDISALEQTDSRAVYELLPKEPQNSSFIRIRLLFENQILSELMLEDSLGQRTAIVLSNIELDGAIDASRFSFEPPAGVDVILDPGA